MQPKIYFVYILKASTVLSKSLITGNIHLLQNEEDIFLGHKKSCQWKRLD